MLCEVGLVPLSGWPSVIENSGIASTTSTATLSTAHGQGRSLTIRPHRANALRSCCSWVTAAVCAACWRALSPALWARTRAVRARIVCRASPISAGSRVRAEIIVTTTTIAAARPSDPTKPTPEMYRPSTETATVLPATTIAAPDVPAACRIDATTPIPLSSCSRCLATRKSP